MDIKKINSLESLNPSSGQNKISPKSEISSGPSFKQLLENSELVKKPLQQVNSTPNIKFSNHAIERMQSRGINFNVQDMKKLGEAVSRAAAKGSKDSLILMNDTALIVSVKNNTVVTVMDKNALKENVFTNIDSTIVM